MPLPKPAKGERVPGSGRKKGVPNHATVEVRTLLGQLLNDPQYQRKLRADFRIRRVHPTIEALAYAYHIGKPKTEIELSGGVSVTQRIEGERERLRGLSLEQLLELAEQSEALIAHAFERAEGRSLPAGIPDVVVDTLDGKAGPETLRDLAGSDNRYSVTSAEPTPRNAISPDEPTG